MYIAISFSTSLLAIAMAFEAKELHKGPLGSGRPSRGLKYCRQKHLLSIKMATALACKIERQPY